MGNVIEARFLSNQEEMSVLVGGQSWSCLMAGVRRFHGVRDQLGEGAEFLRVGEVRVMWIAVWSEPAAGRSFWQRCTSGRSAEFAKERSMTLCLCEVVGE